jgi:MFS family permease
MFGAVFGLASVVGPIVGGYFTDQWQLLDIGGLHIAGWRWCFYVNLPTSVIALAMITVQDAEPRPHRRRKDRLGWRHIRRAVDRRADARAHLRQRRMAGPLRTCSACSHLLGRDRQRRSSSSRGPRRRADPAAEPVLVSAHSRQRRSHRSSSRWRSWERSSTCRFTCSSGLAFRPPTAGMLLLPLMAGLILSATLSGRFVSRKPASTSP